MMNRNYFDLILARRDWSYSVRVPKVPFSIFDKLENEIQNSILRF